MPAPKEQPAATLLHLGPGLANGLANFHNARKARVPVVSIVGEHSTAHLRYDAPLSANIENFARTVSDRVRTAEKCDTNWARYVRHHRRCHSAARPGRHAHRTRGSLLVAQRRLRCRRSAPTAAHAFAMRSSIVPRISFESRVPHSCSVEVLSRRQPWTLPPGSPPQPAYGSTSPGMCPRSGPAGDAFNPRRCPISPSLP